MRFLTAILCLISLFTFAQQNDALRNYYTTINKAELAIVDNDLAKAKKQYEAAFTTGYSFPIDTYNALRVSYNLKDTLSSITYFNELARLGQEKEKFLKYFLHTDAPNDTYLDYATKDYDTLHAAVSNGAMHALAKRVDMILAMDQDCRKREMSDAQFAACNDNVRDFLYQYIDTYGFPGHRQTGLFEKVVGQGPNPSSFDLIFWHMRGMTEERIYDIALDNVHKGLYDARKYARGFCFGNSGYEVSTSFDPVTRKQLQAINAKRAEIYLEPLEDHSRKIAFMRKYTMTTMDYWFMDPFLFGFAAGGPLKIIE